MATTKTTTTTTSKKKAATKTETVMVDAKPKKTITHIGDDTATALYTLGKPLALMAKKYKYAASAAGIKDKCEPTC